MAEIPSLLSALSEKHPDAPAIITEKKAYSFAELDMLVRRAMERLIFAGIKKGERVAIVLPNNPEYIAVLIALWHLRAVACPLSTRFTSQNVLDALKQINGNRLITQPDQIFFPAPGKILMHNVFDIVQKASTAPVKAQKIHLKLKDDATVMLTSGSAGTPKAVVHTFGNHYYNALGSNQHIPFGPGDRWILSLPLYHVGGLGILFRALVGGGAVVIAPDKLRLIRAIKKFKITHASLVSTQLYRMDYPAHNFTILSKLKCILLGGSAIPETLIRRALKASLPIYKTYGLTEMASQVITSVKGSPDRQIVLPYRELKTSPEGEILVRGKTLFKGYWANGKLDLPLTADGWFSTGDLGQFSNNQLVITGRKDNMFISGGENIYPEEIERSLCALEGIEDALVIPLESKQFGLRPVAFLKINSRGQASPERFRKQLEVQIPRFKIPDAFYRWPDDIATGEALKADRKEFARLVKNKKLAL